jgi:inhibitor of cysteine peptidase
MEPLQVSLADDGRTVTVAAGQQVVVRLPENSTTGYRWTAPAEAVVVADEYRSPGSAASGAAGERVFTLGAATKTGEMRFELKRPWGDGAPERTFTLRLGQGN